MLSYRAKRRLGRRRVQPRGTFLSVPQSINDEAEFVKVLCKGLRLGLLDLYTAAICS